MYCSKCGARNADVDRFCGTCGTEIVRQEQPPQRQTASRKLLRKLAVQGVISYAFGYAALAFSCMVPCFGFMALLFNVPYDVYIVGLIFTICLGIIGLINGAIGDIKARKINMKNGNARIGIVLAICGMAMSIITNTALLVILSSLNNV